MIRQWWRCVVRRECGYVYGPNGCPTVVYRCGRAKCAGRRPA